MGGPTAYLVVLAASALTTAVVVPGVVRISHRRGLLKPTSGRSVHTTPIPELGGVAMFAGVLVGLFVASRIGHFRAVFSTSQVAGVLACVVIAFGAGIIDDLRSISAPAKVAGLVLSGSVLAMSGVSIIYFRVPFFDSFVLSRDLSALVTVLWVVGMCNAINLIDGLDGLAAGIVAIAGSSLLAYSARLSHERVLTADNIGPLVAVLAVGVCAGFLVHNFHPASIIMGDGGALMLGALMAAATVAVGGNSADPFTGQSWFFFAPIAVPLLILGIPIFDTAWSIFRRARSRTGVTEADRGHLHHRLMEMGHGHRRTVLLLWAWTAVLSAFVLIPVYTGRGISLVPLAVAAMGLALFTVFARGSGGGGTSDDDAPPQDQTIAGV